MPFYCPQTLEMSMYIFMASVSLFLQEIFIQQNKHNIFSSLLQCLYERSFFKECGNVTSKKLSEHSVWHCRISSWVSQGHVSSISPNSSYSEKVHFSPSQSLTPLLQQPMFSVKTSARGRKSRAAKEQKEGGKHHNIF